MSSAPAAGARTVEFLVRSAGLGKGLGAGDAEGARGGEILHLADHRRRDTLASAEQVDRPPVRCQGQAFAGSRRRGRPQPRPSPAPHSHRSRRRKCCAEDAVRASVTGGPATTCRWVCWPDPPVTSGEEQAGFPEWLRFKRDALRLKLNHCHVILTRLFSSPDHIPCEYGNFRVLAPPPSVTRQHCNKRNG